MMLLVILIASIILALVRRGNLGNLAQVHLRWSGLILAGLAIQLIVFQPFWQQADQTRALTPVAYMLSLFLLLLALAANLRLPGMALIALGFALNSLAIVLNGGHMPASPEALALSGLAPLDAGQAYNNSIGATPETRVAFLTDIFAIPSQMMFHNVFSIGDVLIAAGGFYLIQKGMVSPKPRP